MPIDNTLLCLDQTHMIVPVPKYSQGAEDKTRKGFSGSEVLISTRLITIQTRPNSGLALVQLY